MKLFILLSYLVFFIYLHISGDLNKYINIKYAYISMTGIVLLTILVISQIYIIFHKTKHPVECGCSLNHEEDKRNFLLDFIYLLPIIGGFALPVATLDATYAENRGMNLIAKQSQTDRVELSDDAVVLKNNNYIVTIQRIYNQIDDYNGQDIQLEGLIFTRKSNISDEQKVFVIRYGIAHCVADSGVFGLAIELPEKSTVQFNEWVRVTGKIEKIYDEELMSDTAIIKVENIEKIEEPEQPYVYFEFEEEE